MKGGKARPSRSIKKISGKLPEILQGAVAKCILQRPLFKGKDHSTLVVVPMNRGRFVVLSMIMYR